MGRGLGGVGELAVWGGLYLLFNPVLVLSIGNRVMGTVVWSSMMNSLLILGVCAPFIVLFDAF